MLYPQKPQTKLINKLSFDALGQKKKITRLVHNIELPAPVVFMAGR